MMRIIQLVLVLLFCSSLYAIYPTEQFVNEQKRTLVVLSTSGSQQSTHSEFLKLLETRGYKLTVKKARDSSITLSSFGEFNYDNVIILAPSEDLGGELGAKSLTEFVEAGHNVFIASSNKVSTSLRNFVSSFGVEFDEDGRSAIDHFNYDSVLDAQYGGKHTVIVSENIHPSLKVKGPVLFNGIAVTLDNKNKFLLPLLTGSATSYGYVPGEEIDTDLSALGKNTVLVGGAQTKNNGARITVVGSLDMLSNKFLSAVATKDGNAVEAANKNFINSLVAWSFQERGFLRHREVHHHKVGETETPENYRVSEDLVYSVIIEEWNGETNQWVPFVTNDIQVEFIMLDPYIRTSLRHTTGGKYEVSFKTPDVYGVYKFKVDYRRPGYTPLVFADQVIVRPMRINEYERFIPAAFPYYASAFSMMFGFFLFGFLFMYTRETKTKQE